MNYDCEPEPGWLDALVLCADDDPSVGAAQAVVLHPDATVNTAGNQLHYLGFSWAPNGECGAGRTAGGGRSRLGRLPARSRPALRRDRRLLGIMFLYCEDTDLCWRLRLAGLRVVVCPDARVRHDYDFGRHPSKLYHLERNRLLMLGGQLRGLDDSPAGTCIARHRTSAAGRRGARRLVATEAPVPSSAARALPAMREQRRAVSQLRRIPDSSFSRQLESRLGPEFGEGVARVSAPVLAAYARLFRLT